MSESTGTPRASRPYMGESAIQRGPEGMLSWDWAQQRLRTGTNYWLTTVRPDGRPHMMPVWGVWLDERFYFSTGASSRKARNLAGNANCIIAPDSAEAIVVEGVAARLDDPSLLRRFVETYAAKYSWPMEVTPEGVRDAEGNGGPVFEVIPKVVFGIGADFASSFTRWRF